MSDTIQIPDESPFDLLWQCAWQANAIRWIDSPWLIPCNPLELLEPDVDVPALFAPPSAEN